ncbi:MAG: PQQ-binding-like beta-propeller repeat protein [Anaerolineae bacterium]|nr:PQQ-binding-like beta-propeller repeat protein [Anaerolineae bacterium]
MFRIQFTITLGLVFLVFSMQPQAAQAVGDGWPVYGHDAAHTNRSSANGPNTSDIKWTYVADGRVDEVVVANDGTVYAQVLISLFDNQVIAVNPDGTLKWSIETDDAQFDFPTVGSDGKVYVILNEHLQADPDYLLALNPADGSTAWSFDLGSVSVGTGLTFGTNSRPTVGPDGTIYAASAFGHQGYGTIFAINPDGTQKWAWDTHTDSLYCNGRTYLIYCAIESSPALAPNGYLYFKPHGSGVIALNSATGAFIWRNNFNGESEAVDPFAQSLSVSPDSVAYTSEGYGNYKFFAVNPNNSVKWTFVTDHWNDAGISTISADGSTVYRIDNGGLLYALDTANGEVRWQFDMGIPDTGIGGAPVLAANGIIYFTTGALSTGTPPGSHGYAYALRADTGELIWQYEVGFVSSDLAMGPDGTLYVPDDTHQLYAFQCADSTCAIPPRETLHTVTNLNDSGTGSLRQAVADSIYGDTIQFQPALTGTIALASPIAVGARVTINGPGTGVITVDGGDVRAIFNVASGKGFNINNFTIANGKPGINANGTIHINHMVFTSNTNPSGSGGALFIPGGTKVSIEGSTFSDNSAYNGGAIYNGGFVTISSSTFSNNQADSSGGAVFNAVHMTISNSTFSSNSAFFGAALDNSSTNSILTIVNTTIAQNQASYGGGLHHVSFVGATTTLQNTIVANNGGSNCDGIPSNGGGNLQYPGNSCGSLPIGNPMLASLADNGGPTRTMALQSGSAAIDRGSNSICAASPIHNLDQRGVSRPVDGDGNGSVLCDVGAFESPLLHPSDAAPPLNYYTTATPTLTWGRVSWATGYEIQVSLSMAFTEPLNFTTAADELSVTTTPLQSGTYYWRVYAKKSDGTPGLWSAIESFVVDIP